MSSDYPRADISGVILAGGRGQRMGGADKGLLEFSGQPLVAHSIAALAPQVGPLWLNANRHLECYRAFGLPVVSDLSGDYPGPLAGLAAALAVLETPYLFAVPCDAPRLPTRLGPLLWTKLRASGAEICSAHDGERAQPLFVLLRRDLGPDLLDYLSAGGRRVQDWYARHAWAQADASAWRAGFSNLNHPQDLDPHRSLTPC